MDKLLQNKLNQFLKNKIESDGDRALATQEDIDKLREIFDIIIAEKWEQSYDGDFPVEYVIVNRNECQRLHYMPLKYNYMAKTSDDLLDILSMAEMNLGIAYGDFENLMKLFMFLKRDEKKKNGNKIQ